MVSSAAKTVQHYLQELPETRRTAIAAVRQVILDNLPAGYEEGMLYGMPSYYIPLSRYPNTYNKKPLGAASLASQKKYMTLYLPPVYMDPANQIWFEQRYAASGKTLAMGKSCVYFKTLADLPLDVVAEAIARTSVEQLIGLYEKSRA